MLRRDPNCTRCKLHKTAQFVCLLGQGPKRASVMLIGEAPGQREDDSGKPFVGKAGHYLDEVLEDLGLPREEVFITNAVSCRPPNNKTPTKTEIRACSHWLQAQLKEVKPKVVLLMGNTPLFAITGETGIKAKRGKPFEKDGIWFVPTYHPSYILRGDYRDDPIFRQDIETLLRLRDGGGLPRERRLNSRVVNEQNFEEFLDNLVGDVAFDIEGTGLYQWAKNTNRQVKKGEKRKKDDPRDYDFIITLVGFGTRRHQWAIIPDEFRLTRSRLARIEERLEDCDLIGQNIKYDLLAMWVKYKVRWRAKFDTMLAHHLLDENSDHGLKALAQRYCHAPNWDVDAAVKKGRGPRNRLIEYNAHDLYYTREMKGIFERDLKRDTALWKVFDRIVMPCVELFTEAEYEGVCVDLSRMDEVEGELRTKIRDCERRLAKFEPRQAPNEKKFNWASTKQLRKLLYEDLKLPVIDRTPTGAPSTSESVLKRLEHPLVEALLELRGARQQLSFFVEGWKAYLVGDRIHQSIKMHGTVTGRPSCEHPNMQQVPRDENIRSLIIAPLGWDLIEGDLSQVELRIATELSGDRAYTEQFQKDMDPHWELTISELERGGGGDFYELTIETAGMYLMSKGLPPNRAGAKILLDVWNALEEKAKSAEVISVAYKAWTNQKTRSWEWWQSEGLKQSFVERGLPDLAEKVQKKALREMRQYFAHLSSSQKRKSLGRSSLEFDDALQVMSHIGASAAQEIKNEWKEVRKKAKAVAFGYIYGMWWRKFKEYARDKYGVKLTDAEAEESRKSFFALYRDLPAWHDRQKKFARRNGYVRTLTGRKRRLPDAQSAEDTPERREAERQAINSPVQGFAAELNLMAALQLRSEFSRTVYRPLLTVHDSILALVRSDWTERVAIRTREVMRHPKLLDELGIKLKIPLDSDVKIGPWGRGVSIDKWRKACQEKAAATSSASRKARSRRGESASTRGTSGTSRNSAERRSRVRLRSAV